MGTPSTSNRDSTRRARIAAQRAGGRRREVRNRLFLASGSVVVVIAVVVALVLVKANSKANPSGVGNGPAGAALASVVSATTGVPAATLDRVGAGTVTGGPTAVNGKPLTEDGKPEMLYLGALFCPYCAAERWPMVVALSRFGTFSGLSTAHSSSSDEYPDTSTFSFYKSTFTSKYLTFAPVEMLTNVPDKNSSAGYTALQTPAPAQQALESQYDSAGSIPFIDIGGKYVEVGNLNGYGPQVLTGKSWSQIATALKDPSSAIAKGVDGSANYLTAAICKLTNNQPATACTPAVKKLEAKL